MRILQMVLYWMQHSRWKKRKTKRKAETELVLRNLECSLFWESSTFRNHFEKVPDRLKFCIPGQVRKWLTEKSAEGRTDLLVGLQNAQRCGIEIAPDDARAMIAFAASKAGYRTRAAFLKQLHGSPLPLEMVLGLVREAQEGTPWLTDPNPNETIIKELAELIDRENNHHTEAFVQTLAEVGQYKLLKVACELLEEELKYDLVKTCFDAHIAKESVYFQDLADMAIWMHDEDAAERLIKMIGNRKAEHLQNIAGKLALFLYRKRECVDVHES